MEETLSLRRGSALVCWDGCFGVSLCQGSAPACWDGYFGVSICSALVCWDGPFGVSLCRGSALVCWGGCFGVFLCRGSAPACWGGCFGVSLRRSSAPACWDSRSGVSLRELRAAAPQRAEVCPALAGAPVPSAASHGVPADFHAPLQRSAVLRDRRCPLLQRAPPGLARAGVPPWLLPPSPAQPGRASP